MIIYTIIYLIIYIIIYIIIYSMQIIVQIYIYNTFTEMRMCQNLLPSLGKNHPPDRPGAYGLSPGAWTIR
jgi:hypothetical protein